MVHDVDERPARPYRRKLPVIATQDKSLDVGQCIDQRCEHLLRDHGRFVDNDGRIARRSGCARAHAVSEFVIPSPRRAEELREGSRLGSYLVAKLNAGLSGGRKQQYSSVRDVLMGTQRLEHRCLAGPRRPDKRGDSSPCWDLEGARFLGSCRNFLRVGRIRRLVDCSIDPLGPVPLQLDRAVGKPPRYLGCNQVRRLSKPVELPGTTTIVCERLLHENRREPLRRKLEERAGRVASRV